MRVVVWGRDAHADMLAVTLVARAHRVARGPVSPGFLHAVVLGQELQAQFQEVGQVSESLVGVIYAEGESVDEGLQWLLNNELTDGIIVVGGGLEAMALITDYVETASRQVPILFLAGFPVGGYKVDNRVFVTAEKSGLLGGIYGNVSDQVRAKFSKLLPEVAFTSAAEVGLSNNNALSHPPTIILNAVAVELGSKPLVHGGAFSPVVVDLIKAVDRERLALGKALGLDLLSEEELLDRYYGNQGFSGSSLFEKMETFPGFSTVRLPDTFDHRFITHDVATSIAPMARMMELVGVESSVTKSVVTLANILTKKDLSAKADLVARSYLSKFAPSTVNEKLASA